METKKQVPALDVADSRENKRFQAYFSSNTGVKSVTFSWPASCAKYTVGISEEKIKTVIFGVCMLLLRHSTIHAMPLLLYAAVSSECRTYVVGV